METRRPARMQRLPEHEVRLLNSLYDDQLYTRIRQLFSEGWTLHAIGQAFNPPRTRSTVRYWANRRHDTAVIENPAPPRPKYPPRGYVSRRPKSPGIPPADLARISALSPLARRYRAKMAPNTPEAIANRELTELCTFLVEQNVTVKELAAAAGVTYRAMARRLGR